MISTILGSLIDGFSKATSINLKQFSFGFGAGNKITDNTLYNLSKTLITLSSKPELTRISLYLNRQNYTLYIHKNNLFFSLEITDEGLESLGSALSLLSTHLTSLTLVIATLYYCLFWNKLIKTFKGPNHK